MTESSEVKILKPEVDEREYKYFVLDNGIRVVTVSHPESEISAASLRMATGMFDEPDDVPGLAHFVEHLLFMGTEKYPVEKEFQEYVQKNGGGYNGYTSHTNTTYFFEIEASHYTEALDRFASFYLCPLLKKDGVARELNAVHSEYEIYFTNDGWKEYQILKSLGSPTKHPFCRFGIGNRETLQREDIHDKVMEFYNSEYSSNLMTLVLYGTETSKELKEYAIKYFSKIRNSNLSTKMYPGTIFHPEAMLNKIVHIVPIKESRTLKLLFPITYELKNYRFTMLGIISHLIGHEAEGSLYYHLKNRGWLTSLNSGNWYKWNGLTIFCCFMKMSVEGESHINEIIEYFFEYVKFAKSLSSEELKRIFEESKKIKNQLTFRFRDNTRPAYICPDLTESLFVAAPEDLLMYSSSCYYDFSEEVFRKEINEIHVTKMMCLWVSSIHSEEFKKDEKNFDTEKWFKTKYRILELPEKLIESIKKNKSVKKTPDYFFAPKVNEFIPKSLDLLTLTDESKKLNIYPRKIYEDGKLKVYYKQDTQFKRPKSEYYIRLFFSSAPISIKNQFCQDLLARLINDAMNEITYYASLCELSFYVRGDHLGMYIRVGGWNDSLRKLVMVIIEFIANFEKKFDQKRYTVIKDELMKNYKNMKKDMIVWTAIRISSFAIHSDATHFFEEFIEVGEKIELKDVMEYYKTMFSGKLGIECLCCGNDTEKGITELLKSSVLNNNDILEKMETMEEKEQYQDRIVKLGDFKSGGTYVIGRKTTNKVDKNSCLVHNIEIGPRNEKNDIISYLLSLTMQSDVFDELRTKQQLGYMVGMRFLNFHNISYCQFYIQSSDVDPVEISKRLKVFIEKYFSDLEKKITDEYFKEQVKVMIQKYIEKHKNLTEECFGYWNEIGTRQFRFGRKLEYAKILENGEIIRVSDILEFYKKYFLSDGRVEFQVQIFSEKYQDKMRELNNEAVKKNRYSEDINFLKDSAKEFYPKFFEY